MAMNHDMAEQLARRIRNVLAEFNDDDKGVETLVRELVEYRRAHLTQPAQAVDVQQYRHFATALDAESTRPGVAEWATVLTGGAVAIRQLADIAEHAEAEIATHRANYDALVIRLGEVTARLEAADGLLREIVSFPWFVRRAAFTTEQITTHLKAADHV